MMKKALKWVLGASFRGEPRISDFRLEEEDFPPVQDGGILCEALYLSVDPYMRDFFTPVGNILPGEQVARIIESRNNAFPEGSLVVLDCGWRSRTVVTPGVDMVVTCVDDLPDKRPSLALGIMGMTGLTAYCGLLGVCQPKQGETVVVNSAAGSVGSAVCQIAKIKGCKVIGFAGSDEKCDWPRSLGLDHAYNYKTIDVNQSLDEAAPDGVDCYFDNVGGEFTCQVLEHMNPLGRVTVCGSISTYNLDREPRLRFPFKTILSKHLKVEGFEVYLEKWLPMHTEAKKQILGWINEGKLTYRETIRKGLHRMPEAFIAMLRGENIEKC